MAKKGGEKDKKPSGKPEKEVKADKNGKEETKGEEKKEKKPKQQ